MRRAAIAIVALVLVGCGATTSAPPASQASPTVNGAATTTRSTEVAQLATLTAARATDAQLVQQATLTAYIAGLAATPIPAPKASATSAARVAHASLAANETASIDGSYRATVLQATENPPLHEVNIQLRIDNLAAADLVFTRCSFLLRNAKSEDTTAINCDENASVSQGSLIVAPGGSLTVNVAFPYDPSIDVQWMRFVPVTPVGTMLFFGAA